MSEYNLPDIQLLQNKSERFMIWIPETIYVVLGASNNLEDALFVDRIIEDKIQVVKRPSGGQTVMLTPKNLIISVAFHESSHIQPKEVFIQINSLIINSLEILEVKNLSTRGISDIAIEGKKILGSSIYRNREGLLYHAVLNVSEPASSFEKYLKHPTKEPDYRQSRKHRDFVTSLHEAGYNIDINLLSDVLKVQFNTKL